MVVKYHEKNNTWGSIINVSSIIIAISYPYKCSSCWAKNTESNTELNNIIEKVGSSNYLKLLLNRLNPADDESGPGLIGLILILLAGIIGAVAGILKGIGSVFKNIGEALNTFFNNLAILGFIGAGILAVIGLLLNILDNILEVMGGIQAGTNAFVHRLV